MGSRLISPGGWNSGRPTGSLRTTHQMQPPPQEEEKPISYFQSEEVNPALKVWPAANSLKGGDREDVLQCKK